MTKQQFDGIEKTVPRHPTRKTRSKGSGQIESFVDIIDGELDGFIELMTGKTPDKVKNSVKQLLPELKTP